MDIWPKQNTFEVADGIFAVIHGKGEMGVSNASFIVEDHQAFVVDTMTFPAMAYSMNEEIKRHDASVTSVLNTHHHIDHMGGNSLFDGARFLGHPESIKALQNLGMPIEAYDRLMPHFRGHFSTLKLIPPEPIEQLIDIPRSGELHVFSPAHTPADIAVWFPASHVLLAGDLCFFGVTPLAIYGSTSGWLQALDRLVALAPKIIVPGHGHIGSLSDLKILREYMATLQRVGRLAVAEQLSLDEALKIFEPGVVESWIEPERTRINLERAIGEAYKEAA